MILQTHIRHAFGGFSLDVALEMKGGVTAITGPSGAGKSTLVRAIAGVLKPQFGHVKLSGETLFDTERGVWVPPHRRRIGFVFQDARLFPHMSVEKNLQYGRSRNATAGELTQVRDMLGLADIMERMPDGLSGGETQRVAIGRALLSQPCLLIMDEPLASLDDARKAEILPYLERLKGRGDVPILYVSHAVGEIARLADHLVLLQDGRILRSGAIRDVLADPEAVRDLGPRMAGAILDAELIETDVGDGLSRLKTSNGDLFLPRRTEPEGTRMRVRIRASDVMLSRDKPDRVSALNILRSEVVNVQEGRGPGAAVALRSGSDRLLARITRRSVRIMGLKPGVSCYAVIKSVSVAPTDISEEHEGGQG